MRRREFITLLASTAATWPIAAWGQQQGMPVVGILNSGAADEAPNNFVVLRQGLRDAGYVEGRNVTIEYRWAENHYDRLPELAADLVRRQVAVIFASGGGVAPPSAKAATTTIPIVFIGGFDPVQSGLVSILNRPGGNITGVSFASNVAETKRLGLLRTTVAHATVMGVLLNPDNASVEKQSRDLNEAARVLGLTLQMAYARNDDDFALAFAGFVQQGAEGLIVTSDAFFSRRIEQLVALAARYAIPAIYATVSNVRDAAAAGGLMSYGSSITEAYRQAGLYIGRILHGEKPGDLPVMLPTRYELVINLKTAKTLGLTVPEGLVLAADEVIE
jgi:putative tryptophan/tyrosine transport system substrate-binding protein